MILEFLDRPIAFHRCFVTLTGSVTAALFLSQALYWHRRSDTHDGWFYKTREQWTEETGLSRTEQETARAKLVGIGVLEEERRGLPAKLFYRLTVDKLEALLLQQVGGKPANSTAGNPPTGRQKTHQPIKETETTTETTAKNNDLSVVTHTPAPAKDEKPEPTEKPTRLPSDWVIPAEWGKWALNEYSHLTKPNVLEIAESFRDYWIAKPGKDAKKLDWFATWRNWVRKDQSRYKPKSPQTPIYDDSDSRPSLANRVR